MADKEKVNTEEVQEEGGEDQPIIPGTTYKTPEEAAKGFEEKQKMIDQQGGEIGELRGQLEETQSAIQQMQDTQTAQQKAESAVDYDKELKAIQDEIAQLDELDDNFKEKSLSLNKKAINLTRQAATEEAKNAAMQEFQKELAQRDEQQSFQQWYEQNPDFNTPEMQQRVKQQIARDKTGLTDPLVAYREVQLGDTQAENQALKEQLEETNRLLGLKKGTEETGKVVGKGQPAGEQNKTSQPKKLSGADLDTAMLEAAKNAK